MWMVLSRDSGVKIWSFLFSLNCLISLINRVVGKRRKMWQRSNFFPCFRATLLIHIKVWGHFSVSLMCFSIQCRLRFRASQGGVSSSYPQKQEPHLGHCVLRYWARPGPSSPASCFDTAPPFSIAEGKKAKTLSNQRVSRLFSHSFMPLTQINYLLKHRAGFVTWPLTPLSSRPYSIGCWWWLSLLWLTCFLQPLNCGSCPTRQHWTSSATTGWTSLTTWSWRAGRNQNRSVVRSADAAPLTCDPPQGPAAPALDDASDQHALHCQRLQRIRALLHQAGDLQRHCERNWTVPVLLPPPETQRRQDFGRGLRVRPWCDRFYPPFVSFQCGYRRNGQLVSSDLHHYGSRVRRQGKELVF